MTHTTPYYDQDGITLYVGDALTVTAWTAATFLLTDPPYGINYQNTRRNVPNAKIVGDHDTEMRDRILTMWGDRPALVFGTWKSPRPPNTRQVIIWDKGPGYGAGLGDCTNPYGHSHEEIYVIGRWASPPAWRRHGSVLTTHTQMASRSGLVTKTGHPTAKPLPLMELLIRSAPDDAIIGDPFAGSGSTLIAARHLGRQAVGVELNEQYAAGAVERLKQGTLWVG
jgi:hypothetical protein